MDDTSYDLVAMLVKFDGSILYDNGHFPQPPFKKTLKIAIPRYVAYTGKWENLASREKAIIWYEVFSLFPAYTNYMLSFNDVVANLNVEAITVEKA